MSFTNDSFVFSTLFSILVFIGCDRGPKLPSEIPGVFPCVLTFTQESVPLTEATVVLQGDYSWTVTGITDRNGVAQMKTNGLFDGTPPGRYKIVVIKTEEERDPSAKPAPQPGEPGYDAWVAQMGKQRQTGPKTFSLVEKQYISAATTPLEIEISDKKIQSEFDLGKKVREKL